MQAGAECKEVTGQARPWQRQKRVQESGRSGTRRDDDDKERGRAREGGIDCRVSVLGVGGAFVWATCGAGVGIARAGCCKGKGRAALGPAGACGASKNRVERRAMPCLCGSSGGGFVVDLPGSRPGCQPSDSAARGGRTPARRCNGQPPARHPDTHAGRPLPTVHARLRYRAS